MVNSLNLKDEDESLIFKLVLLAIFALFMIVMIIWLFCAGGRIYDVWAQGKEGEAELAKAESNRQIKTLEAKAHEESARHLANAEIIRAQGVAQANQIIGESLKQNEAYLRYLWINNLNHSNHTVVYVPTEANLPILEAGRMK